MKMKLFRKLKILWVWLLVLTCVPFLSENVCAGEKYTEDIINEDQEAYKIDKENMTISHGDQIYHYKITGESDKPDIYIYFSDGAEPSEAYSSMAKLSALIMVTIGVGVFLYTFLRG